MSVAPGAQGDAAALEVERGPEGRLALRLSGAWTLQGGTPAPAEVLARGGPEARAIAFETAGLGAWDTALLTFLVELARLGAERGLRIDPGGLPDGVPRLMALAAGGAGAQVPPDSPPAGASGLATRVGSATLERLETGRSFLEFLGQTVLALGRLGLGRARMRPRDLWSIVQDCGSGALGVVSLISLLVGLILAMVGSVQLRMFGAEIYVADLVGIAMTREMGAMMTGILMAGRTGAAFAARLGTMTVNEEVDALRTFGVSPVDFLVLPRLLGLVLMMPLLCVYADAMGILGGGLVGVGMLDIPSVSYARRTLEAITLGDVTQGLIKSVVYGVIVALASCHRGMSSGRSASSVGLATTAAVVTSIVSIIVADAVMVLVFDRLGW